MYLNIQDQPGPEDNILEILSMTLDPKQFRDRAAQHAEDALEVAAEIMNDPELSPAVRLEAGKWITKVADLDPKPASSVGGQAFQIVFNMGGERMILSSNSTVEKCQVLDSLLDGE